MVFRYCSALRNTSGLNLNTGKYPESALGETDSLRNLGYPTTEPKTTEGQLSRKTDYSLLPLQRMVTSGHSTRKSEAYSGNLNSLPPLQPQQCIKLKENSIWQLPAEGKMGTKKGIK